MIQFSSVEDFGIENMSSLHIPWWQAIRGSCSTCLRSFFLSGTKSDSFTSDPRPCFNTLQHTEHTTTNLSTLQHTDIHCTDSVTWDPRLSCGPYPPINFGGRLMSFNQTLSVRVCLCVSVCAPVCVNMYEYICI